MRVLGVSRETSERLNVFAAALLKWNRAVRLVGGTHADEQICLNIRDSLAIVPHLGSATDIADLGSGAGFPGLIVAITTGRHVSLVESDQRKAAFLREAARLTSAPATIISRRFEDLSDLFDLVMARAVAPLPLLLSLVQTKLRTSGRCLFPKGATYKREIADASRLWSFTWRGHETPVHPQGCLIEISNLLSRS